MIPYGRQSVDDDDIAAVTAVLKGDWLTQGPAVDELEARLCEVTGARHAVAFSSGTAALHAACAAAGLGPGDRVAVPALTFAASAACATYVGATPVVLDIDPATLNLDPATLPADVDALVAVHYAGLPVDLERITARPRVVIEDAAHALGARTPDGPVGNCAHSDLCCFSFHPVKVVTTGEGGAVTTNDDELAGRLRRFGRHGVVPRPDLGGWAYEIAEEGHNLRLSDIAAALGTSQLAKLERFVARRNELADRYRVLLADLPVTLPPAAPVGWRHAYHLFPVQVPARRHVYDALRADEVMVQVHYVPLYRHPRFGGDPAAYPATEAVYDGLLSLPLFPDLTEDEHDRVVAALGSVLSEVVA